MLDDVKAIVIGQSLGRYNKAIGCTIKLLLKIYEICLSFVTHALFLHVNSYMTIQNILCLKLFITFTTNSTRAIIAYHHVHVHIGRTEGSFSLDENMKFKVMISNKSKRVFPKCSKEFGTGKVLGSHMRISAKKLPMFDIHLENPLMSDKVFSCCVFVPKILLFQVLFWTYEVSFLKRFELLLLRFNLKT